MCRAGIFYLSSFSEYIHTVRRATVIEMDFQPLKLLKDLIKLKTNYTTTSAMLHLVHCRIYFFILFTFVFLEVVKAPASLSFGYFHHQPCWLTVVRFFGGLYLFSIHFLKVGIK